jgi:hypothetical protein
MMASTSSSSSVCRWGRQQQEVLGWQNMAAGQGSMVVQPTRQVRGGDEFCSCAFGVGALVVKSS